MANSHADYPFSTHFMSAGVAVMCGSTGEEKISCHQSHWRKRQALETLENYWNFFGNHVQKQIISKVLRARVFSLSQSGMLVV